MKMLKKLALVSAVSMISAGAFAMEAMDDETMAATTGQDGITILVAPGTRTTTQLGNTAGNLGVSAATLSALDIIDAAGGNTATANNTFKAISIKQVVIHDNDGWTAAHGGTADTANSGALVIGDGSTIDSTVIVANDTAPISILIDSVGDSNGSSNAGGGAMLNVRISTPTLGIKVGSVGIADSYNTGSNGLDDSALTTADAALSPDDVDNAGAVNGNGNRGRIAIMNGMEIILGATTINIQLGNESQGSMIAVNAAIVGGLTINNFALNDTAGAVRGGSIGASSLSLVDVGGANLTAGVAVDVGADPVSVTSPLGEGLYVTLGQLGHATNGANLTLNNQYLGSNTANDLGDVQMLGLNLNGTTLVIRGH